MVPKNFQGIEFKEIGVLDDLPYDGQSFFMVQSSGRKITFSKVELPDYYGKPSLDEIMDEFSSRIDEIIKKAHADLDKLADRYQNPDHYFHLPVGFFNKPPNLFDILSLNPRYLQIDLDFYD